MSKDSDFRISGKHVLLGMVLFFGGIMAANGWMAYQAVKTFDGLEREDPYRRGKDYNQVIEEAQKQAALGWQVEMVAEISGVDAFVRLNVTMRDKTGVPLNGLDGVALFWRPVDDGLDVETMLIQQGNGLYVGEIQLPAHGQWDVRLEMKDGSGNKLNHRERIIVRAAA